MVLKYQNQNTVVKTRGEHRCSYGRQYSTAYANDLDKFWEPVFVRLHRKEPYFVLADEDREYDNRPRSEEGSHSISDSAADGYSLACEIKADMSKARPTLSKEKGPKGAFWNLEFDVVINFGATELAASIAWKDSKVRDFPHVIALV